jgi:hypothetical protein
VLTQFLSLSDLTGTNATGFTIGVLDGTPVGGAPMNNPIDYSFLADPSVVKMGLPTGLLTNGALKTRALSAGPSTVTLALNLAGSVADLTMLNTSVEGTIGNATDQPTNLPANMKIENPLAVFETLTANGANQGLCGDITVKSLASIAAPASLIKGGTTACTENYTAANSLLDILIGGCHVFGGLAEAVVPTPPDVPTPPATNPVALTPDNNKHVTVPGGDNDAYSAYLQFTANRAHFTGESCAMTTDCQTGQTCTGGVCTPQ